MRKTGDPVQDPGQDTRPGPRYNFPKIQNIDKSMKKSLLTTMVNSLTTIEDNNKYLKQLKLTYWRWDLRRRTELWARIQVTPGTTLLLLVDRSLQSATKPPSCYRLVLRRRQQGANLPLLRDEFTLQEVHQPTDPFKTPLSPWLPRGKVSGFVMDTGTEFCWILKLPYCMYVKYSAWRQVRPSTCTILGNKP